MLPAVLWSEDSQSGRPLDWPVTHYSGATEFDPERYEVTFPFNNRSQSAVTLISASTSCGCVAMDFSEKTIAPGEEDSLTILINLRGRSGDQRFLVSVAYEEDEKRFQQNLSIELDVPRLITISPPIVIWDSNQLPEYSVIRVTVHPSQPVMEHSLRNVPDWITAEWIRTEDEAEDYQLILTPLGPPEERRLTTLQFVTDHPDYKRQLTSIYLRLR